MLKMVNRISSLSCFSNEVRSLTTLPPLKLEHKQKNLSYPNEKLAVAVGIILTPPGMMTGFLTI
ncbi:hypothetical protein CFP56_042654 [Quercus suber]|uniref:Uncharacterized protein n=1 Tax=Quercus suber TaxID=58331 RepID=A0AAW0LJG2_QUESU